MTFRTPTSEHALPRAVADIPIPTDQTVYDAVFGAAASQEQALPALTDVTTGETLTFGQYRERVDACAGALAAYGIGPGCVVGLYAPNGIAFAVAFHGIMRAGATITPIGALATVDDIIFQLRDSGATALLYTSGLSEAAQRAARAAGVDETIVLDTPDGDWATLLRHGHRAPSLEIDPLTHVAAMPYSSGTTGRSKGVCLSHHNLAANIRQTVHMLHLNSLEPGWSVMAPLPFFHIYGMNTMLNSVVAAGCHLLTMPKFDLETFLAAHEAHGVRCTFAAPPIMVGLAKHPAVEAFDLSDLELIISAAAPLDATLAEAVASRLDCDVVQGYGMTETSPLTYVNVRGAGDVGSIGYSAPNTEGKLVDLTDPNHREIPVPSQAGSASADGEIWVRGPQVMLGYHDNPQATAETITEDGWLRTGDIARYDSEGFLFVIDRAKELIKYKGYQVAPAELEALLLTHPDVADAAVVPHRREEDGEEVPRAFVVLAPDAALTSKQLKEWVAERVSPYKKIRRVDFIDQIPKSSSGKILRRVLKAR